MARQALTARLTTSHRLEGTPVMVGRLWIASRRRHEDTAASGSGAERGLRRGSIQLGYRGRSYRGVPGMPEIFPTLPAPSRRERDQMIKSFAGAWFSTTVALEDDGAWTIETTHVLNRQLLRIRWSRVNITISDGMEPILDVKPIYADPLVSLSVDRDGSVRLAFHSKVPITRETRTYLERGGCTVTTEKRPEKTGPAVGQPVLQGADLQTPGGPSFADLFHSLKLYSRREPGRRVKFSSKQPHFATAVTLHDDGRWSIAARTQDRRSQRYLNGEPNRLSVSDGRNRVVVEGFSEEPVAALRVDPYGFTEVSLRASVYDAIARRPGGPGLLDGLAWKVTRTGPEPTASEASFPLLDYVLGDRDPGEEFDALKNAPANRPVVLRIANALRSAFTTWRNIAFTLPFLPVAHVAGYTHLRLRFPPRRSYKAEAPGYEAAPPALSSSSRVIRSRA